MKLSWLKFAFYNTLRNRRRSAVTVTVAALGTAAILLAGGFAYSTYEGLAQISARSTGHLIIGKPQHFTSDQDVPLQYGLDDAASLQAKILADPAVRYVLPRIEYSGLISNGDKSTIMLAVGIDPDAEFSVKGPTLDLKKGELIQTDSAEAEIVLGEGLARSLKAQPGSTLTLMASTTDGALNAVDVTVKGIVSTGVPDLDKRLVYSNIKTAQKLLNTKRVSSLGVFLNSMEATMPAQARLAGVFPELTVQNWLEQAFFYKSVRDLYNRIFGALGAIISVIVVFVVANAMAMAIIERTREIGSLRAMGTLPGQLIRSFSFEGMFLGGAGAALGAVLAISIALLLTVFPVQMPPPPGRSSGYPLLISIDVAMYVVTLVTMVVLSMLSSAFIARKTLRQPIVDALAHN
ncbi:FtsX-like permease family protein [Undibacterium sp. TS12]|uniref:ABC transporter permease n=1 Tax=Undibacterium sp. TS12 TaxID=2908202 RepID=UPI001F4C94C5|nr:FtsX-like permease family protein [Undibacterium sp. TS12]MCH8619157.1 FtsX-like permease family protein [Undibacterium sp. TS12]